jgi:hypothetical protein
MKYIRNHNPRVEEARTINQCTLSSLFYRQYVAVSRGRIVETSIGSDALDNYIHAKVAERAHEADLAASVKRLMAHPAHGLILMKRRSA